jgi:hypothetical protein
MRAEARLDDLPQDFALLYDRSQEKFETPLDAQGIADIDSIFELAIRTYPDRLPCFRSSERNEHHIYWTEDWWKNYANNHEQTDRSTILEFRNSTPQKAYVPKKIHWWIEQIMIPPPPPPIEVMQRRNAAWEVASILLKEAMLLDKARSRYSTYRNVPRLVYGCFEGLTPASQRKDFDMKVVTDNEFLLSELNGRLQSWRDLSHVYDAVPPEDRFISAAKLVSVRALGRRIKEGAIIPRVPTDLVAA